MKTHPKLRVGLVGATGMVGQSFAQMLEERKFPLAELRPFASEQSVGQKYRVGHIESILQALRPNCFDGLDVVFFSSGDDISQEWAPQAVKSGAWVVDNSAAFRRAEDVLLVVPEVNGDLLDRAKETKKPQIIANPNCSTIQLVVALNPLHKVWGIEQVQVASYQAVSGAGKPAHDELLEQAGDILAQKSSLAESRNFPHAIGFNCIPQIGSFGADGFCSEESKIRFETKKILRSDSLRVSAFTVRVPVLNAHSEAVWVRLKENVQQQEIWHLWQQSPGLVVQDDIKSNLYPTPRVVSGKDPVYVGRLHQDPDDSHTWLMWIVSDNIRKGAALNGLQIAERIFDISPPA